MRRHTTSLIALIAPLPALAGPCMAPGVIAPVLPPPDALGGYLGEVRTDGARMITCAPSDSQNAMNSGAVMISRRDPSGWTHEATLRIDSPNNFLYFGASADIEGDLAVIGIPGVFGYLGAVIAYRRVDGVWQPAEGIQRINAEQNTGYGNVLDLEGDTVMVSSQSSDHGKVHVFEWDGSAWAQQPDITCPDPDYYYFGTRLVVEDDYAAISASYSNDGGAVFVYRRTPAGWLLESHLPSPVANIYEDYGVSLAIHGERLAVGTYNNDTGFGRVDIYQRDPSGVWMFTHDVSDPSPSPYEGFAYSVALDHDRLFVGCSSESAPDPCYALGSVYIFEPRHSGWALAGRLQHPENPCESGFGSRVAVSPMALIVSAPYDTTNPNQHGRIVEFPIDEPLFVASPLGAAVAPGETAVMTADCVTSMPHTPRWRKNGVPLTNDARISGADSLTLTITVAQPSDFGAYDCTVENSCGELTASAPAALVVMAPPQPSCPGDADGSGQVTFADITSVLTNFNQICP